MLPLDIEELVQNQVLYFAVFHADTYEQVIGKDGGAIRHTGTEERYEIGLVSNYQISGRNGATALIESNDAIRIFLEDVLLDGDAVPFGNSSTYALAITSIKSEGRRIKITGALKSKIGLMALDAGKNYSGAALEGYVAGYKVGGSGQPLEAIKDF